MAMTPYPGQRDPITDEPLLCDCGALATHTAVYYDPNGDRTTPRQDRVACTQCATEMILRPDPPRYIKGLPAWLAWRSKVRMTATKEQTAANLRAQQQWQMDSGPTAHLSTPVQDWRATLNAEDGPSL